jgi:hypothetical protein
VQGLPRCGCLSPGLLFTDKSGNEIKEKEKKKKERKKERKVVAFQLADRWASD